MPTAATKSLRAVHTLALTILAVNLVSSSLIAAELRWEELPPIPNALGLADLPRVAVAAPSPAPVVDGRLLVIGGDDGAQVNTLPKEHKGFRRDVPAYDPKKDRWEHLGAAPFAQVTTSAVLWKDRIVIRSGEIKPGLRSPEVWSAKTR